MRSIGPIGLAVCLFGGGCLGPHYTKHPLAIFGEPAPEIVQTNMATIESRLSTNPAPRVNLCAAVTGFITTPFKCLGVQGWKDFEMNAEARGVVVQNRVSTDRFLTVDLKLSSLIVSSNSIPISAPRFMRLEIFLGKVPVERKAITNSAALVAKGKLTWDADGWFEIHPQCKSDVHVEAKESHARQARRDALRRLPAGTAAGLGARLSTLLDRGCKGEL